MLLALVRFVDQSNLHSLAYKVMLSPNRAKLGWQWIVYPSRHRRMSLDLSPAHETW